MCEVTSRAEPVAAADRGRLRFVGVQCLPSGPGRDGAIPRLATTGALAVYLSVLASLLSGAAPAGYRLTVEVENVRNAQGVVGVLVFNTAQGWPEQFSAGQPLSWSPKLSAAQPLAAVRRASRLGQPEDDFARQR